MRYLLVAIVVIVFGSLIAVGVSMRSECDAAHGVYSGISGMCFEKGAVVGTRLRPLD